MGQLDYYDKFGNHLGIKERSVIHEEGLWHKTVHCWIYDDAGNVYFQIRSESGKLYTTASGHVDAGETVQEALKRESLEEVGVEIDFDNTDMVEINVWKYDDEKEGNTYFDRAFSNVYISKLGRDQNFRLDCDEILGVVKVNACDTLELLRTGKGSVRALKILRNKTSSKIVESKVTLEDFFVTPGENAFLKYGKILQSVCKKRI